MGVVKKEYNSITQRRATAYPPDDSEPNIPNHYVMSLNLNQSHPLVK